MLRRVGRVVGRRGKRVDIEFSGAAPGCAGCGSGCGLLQLAGAFHRPRAALSLVTGDAERWPAGSRVSVVLPLRGLPRALLVSYALPWLSMLAGAAGGYWAWPGQTGDGAVLLGCLAGLGTGSLLARGLRPDVALEPRLGPAADD